MTDYLALARENFTHNHVPPEVASAAALISIAESLAKIADGQIAPGPCGNPAPGMPGTFREFCDLKAGHAGLHQRGDSTWGVSR
jgi:hypothetical protein